MAIEVAIGTKALVLRQRQQSFGLHGQLHPAVVQAQFLPGAQEVGRLGQGAHCAQGPIPASLKVNRGGWRNVSNGVLS